MPLSPTHREDLASPGTSGGGVVGLFARRLLGVVLALAVAGLAGGLTWAAEHGAPSPAAAERRGKIRERMKAKDGVQKLSKSGKSGKGKMGKGKSGKGKSGKGGKSKLGGMTRRQGEVAAEAAKPLAVRAIDTRRWFMAMKAVNQALAENPDDFESRSMLAVVRARTGWYAEAESEFTLSWGSSYYETEGIGPHADTLRAEGRYAEAAALRLGRRWVVSDESEELVILLGAAEDLMDGGDVWGAIDLGEEALALRPRSPVVYAVLALAWIEAGDLDEAEYYVWMSEHVGGSSVRGPIAESEIALRRRDPVTAEQIIEENRKQRISSWQFAVQISEARRLQGNPAEALWMLDLPQWNSQAERPELQIAEMKLEADLGNLPEVETICRKLKTTYPGSLQVMGAVRYAEQRLGHECPPIWPSPPSPPDLRAL